MLIRAWHTVGIKYIVIILETIAALNSLITGFVPISPATDNVQSYSLAVNSLIISLKITSDK